MSKPVCELIESVRDMIYDARCKIRNIGYLNDNRWKERLEPMEGTLSCVLISLYSLNEEIYEWELRATKSFAFRSRGIGSESVPCFCCGAGGLNSNISAFISSEEDGEKINKFFKFPQKLDYRDYEPNRIQFKVGGCQRHLLNLQKLNHLCNWGGINQEIVNKSLKMDWE